MKKALLILAALIGLLVLMPPDPAFADYRFAACDASSGVASGVTSCEFAANVRTAYLANGTNQFWAYSPITTLTYLMNCAQGQRFFFDSGQTEIGTVCVGGDDAVVVFW